MIELGDDDRLPQENRAPVGPDLIRKAIGAVSTVPLCLQMNMKRDFRRPPGRSGIWSRSGAKHTACGRRIECGLHSS